MEEFISDDHALEYLLAFDGRVHYFERGFWLKFEIKRVAATPERPHGLRYSFTLHNPRGKRPWRAGAGIAIQQVERGT
jgi:hypothetical protein